MTAHRLAQWLVRVEIPLLALIYVYFVVSDNVPVAAFVLIGLIWLARAWTTRRLSLATPFDLPVLILLAWLPVTLAVTTNAWLSLPKVYGVLLGVAFFYAIVNQISSRRDLAWATLWLVAACIAISAAGLIGTDWAQDKIISASFIYDRLPHFVQGIPRSIAGGFARNGVGGTLTFIVPLLAALVVSKSKGTPALAGGAGESQKSKEEELFTVHHSLLTALVWLALALSLVTLALTQSRGAILGASVGLLAVVTLRLAQGRFWREKRFAWLIVAGAAALAVIVLIGQGNALLEFLLRMDARSGTLASRLEVWQRGVMMVQDFPITGIGIGTYNSIAHSLYPFFIAAPDEVVAHAHNNLLEVAVDVGIPGLIAYVALLTGFVVCAVRAYRATADAGVRALMAGLGFGMLAHQVFGLTDAFILGTKPGLLMWIYFALVGVAYVRRNEWRETGDV
ncbi:MAG: O-antigen ligase family protein [Chloroflexota bacterium]|nr:O-antigen ligase family protein [Chloroflexota bacterium]